MPFLIGVLLGEGPRECFKKGEEERGGRKWVMYYSIIYSASCSVPALSPLVTKRISFGAVSAYVARQVWGLAS